MCTARALRSAGSDCAPAGCGVGTKARAAQPKLKTFAATVIHFFLTHRANCRDHSCRAPRAKKTKSDATSILIKLLEIDRLEKRADWLGQCIPAPAQKRREKAKQ